MIRNKCQKIRRRRKFQSTSSLWGGKKGTFGGPVEHVYIDTRLRDVREAHKRRRKRKSPTVKKKNRNVGRQEKVHELAQNSTAPMLVKKNRVCSEIIVATLSKPQLAFLGTPFVTRDTCSGVPR